MGQQQKAKMMQKVWPIKELKSHHLPLRQKRIPAQNRLTVINILLCSIPVQALRLAVRRIIGTAKNKLVATTSAPLFRFPISRGSVLKLIVAAENPQR